MSSQIVIVGRTNVGKSLLFNKLVQQKKSLVVDHHGVTKDFNSGFINLTPNSRISITDTSGFTDGAENEKMTHRRIIDIVGSSSLILYVIPADEIDHPDDHKYISEIRGFNKDIFLVVNKVDLLKKNFTLAEAYKYGIKDTYEISAKNNTGLSLLRESIIKNVNHHDYDDNIFKRITIVGKPNTGKSTLVNILLKEEIMLTSDKPGTTIDCIDSMYSHKGKLYLIYDTAGLSRKSKSREKISSYSMLNTIKNISDTDLSLFLIDGTEEVSKQNKTILDYIRKSNKPYLIVINKIDKLDKSEILQTRKKINYFLNITDDARCVYISALKRKNIANLKKEIHNMSMRLHKRYKSSNLTKILNEATTSHPPPLVNNRRIKLKFAQQTDNDNLSIVIHGNQTSKIPKTYTRYLVNYFINKLKLNGIPLRIIYSKQENPFI